MKITILTFGSRGDIQPFAALAGALQKAGHNVVLAGPSRFADLVLSGTPGVSFAPLSGDPAEISKSINAAGTNVFRMLTSIRNYVLGIAPQIVCQIVEACADADLIIHSFLFTTGAHSLARQLGIPDISIQTFPMFAPTGDFPNVALPAMGRAGNYLSHWFATQIFWYGGNSGFRQIQHLLPDTFPRSLSWPFSGERPTPLLIACSPSVVPASLDWPAYIHLTGYLFLDDEQYQPPGVLTQYLQAGPPPVCISFGSMVNAEAEHIHQILCEALEKRHERAIFLTGWGAFHPAAQSETVLHLAAAPHSWLLPRCKAVIHHGGAGTTAAGLRAGIPNLVIPHAVDQPFWGARVKALGAGPSPIPVQKLSVSRLLAALAEIDNGAIISGAQNIGRLIRAENGMDTAIDLIMQEKARYSLKNHNL
jgi:sterol 3beta-glucosyltransferase